jgi:hypothetical protein
MTLRLSPEQSQAWNEGGWLSLELQETLLEDVDHQQIDEPVVVVLASGQVAFGITAGEVQPC